MKYLEEAIWDGDLAIVRSELEKSPEKMNFCNESGSTLLWIAVHRRHRDIVKLLLELGADVNQVNKCRNKEAALHSACDDFNDHDASIVETLLTNGADVSMLDEDLRTPIHILGNIKSLGYWDAQAERILQLLLSYGAEFDLLPIAAAFGNLQDVIKSVKNGADTDTWDYLYPHERTALHIAAQNDDRALLEYLLNLDAAKDDVNPVDSAELTPLDVACSDEIKSILKSKGGKSSDSLWDYSF